MIKIITTVFKVLGNISFIFLLLFMLIVGISLLRFPDNYKIYSVTTGSMSPVIQANSLILVRPLKEYKIGDIVTIKTDELGKTITHRIIKKITKNNQIIFETKGDANKSKDLESTEQKEIIGKVFFVIPYLGLPIIYSKTLPGLIFLIVIPSTIIIYSEVINIKNELKKIFFKRKKTKKNKS